MAGSWAQPKTAMPSSAESRAGGASIDGTSAVRYQQAEMRAGRRGFSHAHYLTPPPQLRNGPEADNIVSAGLQNPEGQGVGELDMAKLSPLLRLKYHNSVPDALAHLCSPETVAEAFSGFQKYLYQEVA